METVVAGENDNGLLHQTEALQAFEQESNLGVDERNAGVIGCDGLALFACVAPRSASRCESRPWRVFAHVFGFVRQRDRIHRIKVEVLLWRDEGQMRLVETRGDEKRFVAMRFEDLH